MNKEGFFYDNYKITSDFDQFVLHKRKVIRMSKNKSMIGKERWEVIGYFASLSSVFTRMANMLCCTHIDDLSIAIKKIDDLQQMIQKVTSLKNE